MKKAKVLNTLSLVFNVIIIAAVAFGVTRSADIVASFKYFTVLSNVLVALAALVCIPFNIMGIAKGERLKKGALLFKFAATVCTTLTFITAATFLSALSNWDIAGLLGFNNLMGENFWLHFVVPVLALISFIFFDKSGRVKFSATLLPLIPILLYGAFYITNIFVKFVTGPAIGGGESADWYGFMTMAQNSYVMFALIIAAFALAGYIIGVLLWCSTRLFAKEEAVAPTEETPVEEKAEESAKEEPAKEEKVEEPKAEEAPVEEKVEEPTEEPQEEEEEPEEDAEVYIPVREEEEEKKPVKKAAKKEAPKAEEKKEAKAEEEVEEKKAQPSKKSAPAKKEEKPAPKKEEKKAAPAKKEAKPAKVYHLTKRKEDGMWAITFVGGSKAVKLFKTKKEAEEALKVLTENQGATALIRNSKGAKAGKFASSIKAEEK